MTLLETGLLNRKPRERGKVCKHALWKTITPGTCLAKSHLPVFGSLQDGHSNPNPTFSTDATLVGVRCPGRTFSGDSGSGSCGCEVTKGVVIKDVSEAVGLICDVEPEKQS